MIKRSLAILFLLLAVFAAQKAEAKTKIASEDRYKGYKCDLDGDGKIEIIRIEDISGADRQSNITILKQDYKHNYSDVGSITLAGAFKKVDFIDLNGDSSKQLAVYTRSGDGCANLAIYSFKNNELFRIFSVGSKLGIATEFHSAICRVKVGRQSRVAGGVSYTDIPEWDSWVWIGDRFIRE